MTFDVLNNPPPQAEIIARWLPERGHQVSICMLAYNHAPYIRDALNSILNQKTNFGFEILVHDDASEDETQTIIREYAERYPLLVKPILQTVNQHSRGIFPSLHFNYPRANLPFVAMCEGDDHWTDECKLQMQVDGLLAHPGINLSFHSAHWIDDEDLDAGERIYGDYADADTILSFTDVIHRVRGWIPFASCMIRQGAKCQLLDFLRRHSYLTIGEVYFQLFGSLPNGALFFSRPMSLYRYRTTHSWTRKAGNDPGFKARHELAMIRSYVELDILTGGEYRDEFIALILTRLLWLFNPLPPPRSLPGVALLHRVHETCQDAIDSTLRALNDLPRRYVIFGCASGCRRALETLDPERVAAIIDRDNRRLGETLLGHEVIGTGDLFRYANCDLLVSTITADRRSIAECARAGEIPAERIHYLFDRALRIIDDTHIPPEVTNL
ncbi:MAG TPA: glycosyltransferase [Rhodocyclaceae bacterium]|nr:glycosyltransferase [Rhodocyclaceae bacterium]HRQ45342.1 glycosyltransferase [Rhodocyclaceae bacterium]